MAGGGPLYDIASHRIDLMNFLFGKPRRATGQCSNAVHHYAVEDNATVMIEYAGGVRGLVDVRWHSHVPRDEFRIRGTNGELDLSTLNESPLATPSGMETIPAPANLHYPCVAEFTAAVQHSTPLYEFDPHGCRCRLGHRSDCQIEAPHAHSAVLYTVSFARRQLAAGRRPSRHVQVTGSEPPIAWSVARNENIAWRVPLPNAGQSGIAVWGDRLFLTTFAAGEKGFSSRITGMAVDAKSGKTLWTVNLEGTVKSPMMYAYSDSTTPTPITDGKHVWFFNASGEMGCWDWNGREVWRRKFTPWASRSPSTNNMSRFFPAT